MRKPLAEHAGVDRFGIRPSLGGEEWEAYFDLYNFAPVGYAKLDGNGVIEEINQAGSQLLGAGPSRLVGRPLLVFVADDDRPEFLDHIRRCRRQDAVVESELALQIRSGHTIPVHLYSRRSVQMGRIRIWTMMMDLTERERLEASRARAEHDREAAEREQQAARAANESKDRFLAMLSHELRTPLTPALFAAVRLMEDDLPRSSRKLAAVIKRSIELEARLIDDLLDVTRISRGKLMLSLEVRDINSVILDAIEVCRSRADASRITIDADLRAQRHHVQAIRSGSVRSSGISSRTRSNSAGPASASRCDRRTTNQAASVSRWPIRGSGSIRAS